DDWKEKYRSLANKHEKMIRFYDVDVQYNLAELEKEFYDAVKTLKELTFIDSEEYLQQAQKDGKTILAEGAQGSLLDIDFGTYPFVTSSNTTAAGACTGLGVAPNQIGEAYGIFKAYTTRVGSGPFPTELFDEDGETMGRVGNEFGATTGRPRRCGWLDLVALKYAVRINGITQLIMMKGDVLSGFKTLKVCTSYNYRGKEISHLPYNIEAENVTPVYTEMKGWDADLTKMTEASELPAEFNAYVDFLEKELEVPISIVSVGPDRKQTIRR
ncbi:MAG: adenylosuccinate synthetase, partial [Salegentibacter sp.]